VDLDEVADELYRVPPEEFMALRTQRQGEAKAEGDKALAKDIGALPKPSAAAWVCNLLVRAHRPEIEGLVELGGLLRDAQENLAGAELKALDTQRRQLIAALTQQARSLAYEEGHPISSSAATQVEETLRTAMSDPEAGEALLTGRLTSPMSYSGGLGSGSPRPNLRLIRSPKAEPREKPAKATADRSTARPAERTTAEERRKAKDQAAEEKRRAAQERRRRELDEARTAAEEATAVAEEAQAAAEEQRRLAEELDEQQRRLQARVAELSEELTEAERAAADVAARLKSAERRRKAAEHAATDAAADRDRAVAHADDLARTADRGRD
jgi:hypothetical protein